MISIPSVRGPVATALFAVIALSLILFANDRVKMAETAAAGREAEAESARAMGEEIIGLRAALQSTEQSIMGGEPVLRTVERIAAEESLTLSATQSAGTADIKPFKNVLTSFRITSAPMTPLLNLMKKLESARAGLIIEELTIRRSIERRNKLDAEIVVAQFEKSGQDGK